MTTPTGGRRQGGFTVLELMVTVVVLAILASIAIPSFSYLAANTKMKSASTNLHLALLKARSEAVKRSANVTLTPANSANWAMGWTIAAGATVLQVQEEMDGVAITPNPATAALTYQSTGRVQGAASPSFNIGQKLTNQRQKSGSDVRRCVSLAANGSPYLKEEACS